MSHKIASALSLLCLITLLLPGCSTDADEADAAIQASVDDSAETTTPAVEAAPETTDSQDQTADQAASNRTGPAEFDATAPLFTDQFSQIDAGTHRFDKLGTEFSASLTANLMIQPNETARVVFSSFDSSGPGDEDLIVLRPRGLNDPTNPAEVVEPEDYWDARDIDTWLANVIPGVISAGPSTTDIGSIAATVFDVELADDVECNNIDCASFASSGIANVWFDPGRAYRVWHLPQGDEQPIIIVAGADADNESWIETADQLVAGMAFGPAQPHPIPEDGILWELGFPSDVSAGLITIPLAGGITFDLIEDHFLYQEHDQAFIPYDGPSWNEMFIARVSASGPISDVADTLAALVDHPSVEVSEQSETTVAGFATTVVSIKGRQAAVLGWGDDLEGRVWFPPAFGRMWLIETPAGPLVITAESFATEDDLIEPLELAERIIETLEFSDGG